MWRDNISHRLVTNTPVDNRKHIKNVTSVLVMAIIVFSPGEKKNGL